MSNSSHPQTRSQTHYGTTDNLQRKMSVVAVTPVTDTGAPGALNDTQAVREGLIASMKRSGISRAEIAERMSHLLNRKVTEQMLNAFTKESVQDRRWPAEYDRAFCAATGDWSLIRNRAVATGLIVIDAEEQELLELGRAIALEQQAIAMQRQAAETIERIKRQREGVSL